MKIVDNLNEFIEKVDAMKKVNPLDLSKDQDLSIAIMNLISIEEHLAFSGAKTQDNSFFDLIKLIIINENNGKTTLSYGKCGCPPFFFFINWYSKKLAKTTTAPIIFANRNSSTQQILFALKTIAGLFPKYNGTIKIKELKTIQIL